MVSPLVLRLAYGLVLQRTGRHGHPVLFQQAAMAAGEAGCKPVATKSIATMIQGFDGGAVVFFKSNLISY
jgi:hypothetical protein